MDHPEKTCITYLLLLQITKRCSVKAWKFHGKRSPVKLLNEKIPKKKEKYAIPWKIPKKKFILVKLRVLKINYLHVFFKVFAKSLSNFVLDFWENCFHKPKLSANRLIYLKIGISKINSLSPAPSRAIVFFYIE